MDNNDIVADLCGIVTSALKHANKELARFQINLDKDPANAFELGAEALRAAAQISVYTNIHRFLSTEMSAGHYINLKNLLEKMKKDVLCRARGGPCSTSPIANLMSDQITIVKADVVDLLEQLLAGE